MFYQLISLCKMCMIFNKTVLYFWPIQYVQEELSITSEINLIFLAPVSSKILKPTDLSLSFLVF